MVGCETELVLKMENAFMDLTPHDNVDLPLNIICLDLVDDQNSFRDMIETLGITFDLIVVNQQLLKMPFEQLRSCFGIAMDFIKPKKYSSVLIRGMLPNSSPHDGELDPFKLLLHMRSYTVCDAALGLFESGLLIVIPRRNPYGIRRTVLDSMNCTYDRYRSRMDKLIPLVTLSELHLWLSDESSTRRFVRNLLELSEEEKERRRIFYEKRNVSIA